MSTTVDDDDTLKRRSTSTGIAFEEIPEICKTVLNTCQTASGRSTFLAGFTFYQIGRYTFTPYNDTAYIIFNTFSLVLSILAVMISSYVTYFMERATTYNGKLEFQQKTNNLYIRGAYQCFLWGTVLYTLGLSRMGFVYYDNSPAKYIPQAIFVIFTFLIFGGVVHAAIIASTAIPKDNELIAKMTKSIDEAESTTAAMLKKQRDDLLEQQRLESHLLKEMARSAQKDAHNVRLRFHQETGSHVSTLYSPKTSVLPAHIGRSPGASNVRAPTTGTGLPPISQQRAPSRGGAWKG